VCAGESVRRARRVERDHGDTGEFDESTGRDRDGHAGPTRHAERCAGNESNDGQYDATQDADGPHNHHQHALPSGANAKRDHAARYTGISAADDGRARPTGDSPCSAVDA